VRSSSPLSIWLLAGVAALGVAGWLAWSALDAAPTRAAAGPALSPAEALQQELLRKNTGRSGDADLNRMYQQISAKHFSGKLPALQVLWEPRLAEVGPLSGQEFTLQGMFGNVGPNLVILLNPALQADRRAVARALCHEIVHAYLYSTGDSTTEHGPAFQTVLQSLAGEGAFEGVAGTDEDRASLRAWLDAESARLDAERVEMDRVAADTDRERSEVERILADLNARATAAQAQGSGWPPQSELDAATAKRDGYNRLAADVNDRVQRDRAALEHFNKEVARYNLMLVYPDGLDSRALVKPK
jgi:predicted SprT family Zn-dependent metalloprotease